MYAYDVLRSCHSSYAFYNTRTVSLLYPNSLLGIYIYMYKIVHSTFGYINYTCVHTVHCWSNIDIYASDIFL